MGECKLLKLEKTNGEPFVVFEKDIIDVIQENRGLRINDIYSKVCNKSLRIGCNINELDTKGYAKFKAIVKEIRTKVDKMQDSNKLVVLFQTDYYEPIRINYDEIYYIASDYNQINKAILREIWNELMFQSDNVYRFDELTEASQERFKSIVEESIY